MCNDFRNYNHKGPLVPHKIPERPWQKVCCDLCEIASESYLVIEDYHSKFLEITKLANTTSATTILYCKSHFARHGIPEEVFTDNGPQFASKEFKKFAEAWSFKHTTSNPCYPQSNGMAERAVQTAKNLLEKAKHDRKLPYLALLAYKSTSIDDIGSPAELLMGRRLRTQLPTTSTMLQLKMMNNIIPKLKARQLKQKTYLPPLTNGDTVSVRTKHQKWRLAVLQQQVAPRSYLVKTGTHAKEKPTRYYQDP